MVAVITNPVSIPNEHLLINQLFDEGLEVLHLRKPDQVVNEIEDLLKQIAPKYYSKIALHQHHYLIERYSLKRIHYVEDRRSKTDETAFKEQRDEGITLSTSIHQINEYYDLSDCFDYCFFGPVFNSISKQGYPSVISNDFKLTMNRNVKIIALGGIDVNKIEEVRNLGFSGIALLGALWHAKNPVEQFKRIQQQWKKAENMC